jgi:GTPase SAR1 family protein
MSKTNAGAASKKGGGKGKQQLLGEELLKVIMVGECGVGKSSLICKLVDNTFSDEPVTSLGMDFKLKTVSAEGKTLKLQIWVPSRAHLQLRPFQKSLIFPNCFFNLSKDTAGQERFR